MAANLLPRDVPQKAYTSPHNRHTAEEYNHVSAYTAPVAWAHHEPPKRSSSDSPMNSMGDRSLGQHGNNGRSNSSSSFNTLYSSPPRSFPQASPRREEIRKPYSSLEGDSGPSQYPHAPPHVYHPQSIASSSHQPLCPNPNQPSPPRQPSSSRSAALHDNLHVSHRPTVVAQGRTHSDTALTVPRTYPHTTTKSNSQHTLSQLAPPAALLQRSAPCTTGTSALLQRSAPNLPTQQYTNAIPHFISRASCSQATLENARYSLQLAPLADHTNEDRHFALEGPNYKVFGVFDGHDGPRAAGFASNYMMQLFDTTSWISVVKNGNSSIIHEALVEFFRATEKDFFKSIQRYIDEKEITQRRIPSVCTHACMC